MYKLIRRKSKNAAAPLRAGTRRRNQAQTTVEFALIVWPFLLLLFATIDYAQLYFYDSSLRHALREAGRFATTGNVMRTNFVLSNGPLQSSYEANKPISRMESIRRIFQTNCLVNTPITNIVVESWPGLAETGTEAAPNKGPGDADDNVRIKVSAEVPMITRLFFTNTKYKTTVTSVFRNEPSRNFLNTITTNYYGAEP